MKGILFVGDSFTWGEGLHYFSNTSNIVFHKKHNFDIKELTKSHIAFKNKNRFSRLVADNFNTWEISSAVNGGSIDTCINEIYDNENILDDIDCLVFQITDEWRGEISIYSKKMDKTIKFDTDILSLKKQTDEYKKYKFDLQLLLNEYGNELEILINEFQMDKIKKVFDFLEQKGITCRLFSWIKSTANCFTKNTFFKDRWIFFENNISNLQTLYEQYPLLSIHGCLYEKYNLQKYDWHLSLEGHKYVSKYIIDNLEKVNFNNDIMDIEETILKWRKNKNKLI